jgi:hypothetical protein
MAFTPSTLAGGDLISGIWYDYDHVEKNGERPEISLKVGQSVRIYPFNPDEDYEVLIPDTNFDKNDFVLIKIQLFYKTEAKEDDYLSENWIVDTERTHWCPFHCVIRT